mmetsp:Transcript_25745/g.37788  ORF Transcript_25745/g.37788 Transcript_25745/m.37788 type:complete len:256 (-) Transcript_25745:857-1624(-)
MQVVLHKVDTRDLIVVGRSRIHNGLYLGRSLAPCGAVKPLVVETALLAHLHFETGIWQQPFLVLFHPRHHTLICEHLITTNCIENAIHQLGLLLQNARIINLPIAIQLLHQRRRPSRGARHVRAAQVGVVITHRQWPHKDRMQRKRRRGGVRRRILARVVNWQDLNELQPCFRAPIGHFFEVEKLPDACRVSRLYGRDRNCHTCALKDRIGVVECLVLDYEGGGSRVVERDLALAAFTAGYIAALVDHLVFVLHG